MTFEELVSKYGEQYRVLIAEALSFLDTHEKEWKLDKPIDRDAYIESLVTSHSV